MKKENTVQENTAQCAIQNVSNSALKPKIVNNGNVFGTSKKSATVDNYRTGISIIDNGKVYG